MLVLVACALAAGGIYWFRARREARPSDLVAYLPTTNASVIYMDVDALRRSGILSMVAGSKTVEEPDYLQFVKETKFDYRQDLDAVAAALKNGRTYLALRGRFHWNSLKDYAATQGGSLSQRLLRRARKPAESAHFVLSVEGGCTCDGDQFR